MSLCDDVCWSELIYFKTHHMVMFNFNKFSVKTECAYDIR